MFDTSRALADMAMQIRTCRSSEGLTLQQLATRSGLAASTIHKVEARQMVPTVSVLLKIAKGLGRRPDELIRDLPEQETRSAPTLGQQNGGGLRADPQPRTPSAADQAHGATLQMAAGPSVASPTPRAQPDVGVWELDLPPGRNLPPLDLDASQRAILLVQQGEMQLDAGGQHVKMESGDCIEVQGGRILASGGAHVATRLMLIVSPRGRMDTRLGEPSPSAPIFG